MTQIRGFVASAVIGLLGFVFVSANQANAEEDRPAEISRLRKLSDQQLSNRLTLLLSKNFRRRFEYEACCDSLKQAIAAKLR